MMEIERVTVEPPRDQQQGRRDGTAARGTSGEPGGTDGLGWPLYVVVAVAVLATGVVNALSTAYDHARGGGLYDIRVQLFWQLSSTIVIAALVPAVANGIRRVRISWRRRTWWTFAGLAIAIPLGFSAAHIVGMVLLRDVALQAYDGSAYHFEWSFAELAYEFRKDVATCVLFALVFWLALSRRDGVVAREVAEAAAATAVAAAASPAPPDHLWLRDGATSIRIVPSEVLLVTSAGNYVEYRIADGTTHLIRATLASEAPRLQPFGIVRVHRTRMVNLHHVAGIAPRASGDFELRLDTGETLIGSRRYRDAVTGLVPPI
jgi:DNA-binding LytR/AlgR family response regulator